MEEENKKISELKPDMDNVSVKVRVIETFEPKTVQTRKGERTISEAIVGDDTGRVKLTLWGDHADTLKEGQAVEVKGGWTTSFRGEVQLNVGFRGEINEIDDEEVPQPDNIPEEVPKGESQRRRYGSRRYGQSRGYRKGYGSYGSRGY
ncbi:MAG: OB-fold nucleic acid binding domain-containing protein [Desulfurococcales archaeon]|nr:OB-fold nucleic acid binding domain-containing protein [Desulfurococcales archaeon]MEB3758480.1 OB-fold nucleic acid binding domain-containing protein [Desulfurococcales archaeon]MEB3773014.1 OB-fold nucleic acid binding domain-containing protein [Desulfurococcales archaeon]MEB3786985.1 OB-fold nucleic acid binding domain-containing protein [Desulfurococcales archaeon]MEB3798873.1 OB-fold nucleic acid binding domain-containing protein [Desulfurococcales archaeon]